MRQRLVGLLLYLGLSAWAIADPPSAFVSSEVNTEQIATPDAESNDRSLTEQAVTEDTQEQVSEKEAAAEAVVAASLEAQQELDANELRAVPLYEEYQLIEWINNNQHLQQVRDVDDCQLVQDIEARAEVLRLPSYQFLWGDMLAWGVCVDQAPRRGIAMLWKAADQGLPAALEQLGRYYYQGTLVQQNKQRALPLMQEAASLGLEKAQLTWARWLVADAGSPLDYPQAYLWLKAMVVANKQQYREVEMLANDLASRMPSGKVKELNNKLLY